jgi:hypothetical protein
MLSITTEYGTLLQNLPATQRKERLRAERGAVAGDDRREIVMVVPDLMEAVIVLMEAVRECL